MKRCPGETHFCLSYLSLSPSLSMFSSSLLLSLSFFRWPFKGYPPTHRRRPLLRLHQRQLHRCKWKRIECYYWLPTKPTKPHSLARMSGLYTFIASSSHPSCHFIHTQPPWKRHHTYRTCVSLRCQFLSFAHLYPHIHECIIMNLLQYLHAAALPRYLMS